MKKIIISIFTILTLFSNSICHAFSFKGEYSAQNMAKYYPQTYNRRYQPQRKTYVYSQQQAKYYGYRTPQNNYYNSGYTRRY